MKDGWTDIFRSVTGTAAKQVSRKVGRRLTGHERAELMELADYRKMTQVRNRVDAIVDGRRHRREAQAVVPPVLQAAVLPRRIPADVQPAQRAPRGHRRAGRRAAHRARRGGQRHRVRGRLPDLRHRLRGRHHLHPARRLRHHRPRRRDAVGALARRDAHAARPADPRLPQLLLPRLHPDRGHRQRALRAQRAGQARRVHHRRGPARATPAPSTSPPRPSRPGWTR